MPYTERRRKFIIGFAYIAVILLIVYLVFKYLLGILMPFIVGFFIAALLEPVSKCLSKRFSLSRKFVSCLMVLLFYATVGTLIGILSIKLFVVIGRIFKYLPDFYNNMVAPALSDIFDFVGDMLARFDNSITSDYGSLFDNAELSLGSAVSALSVSAVSFISGILANLPMFIVEVVLGIVSTFFFASDYANITSFIMRLFDEKTRQKISNVKKCFMNVIAKYGRSYFFIMLITFGEVYLALALARIKNAAVLAFMIAVFDILPVFGVGFILVPWGIVSFVSGDIRVGSILLVSYAVIAIVRNIIEPKIVGREVGLHPIVALVSMFVGTRLFGFIGLFGLPCALSIVKSLSDSGVIVIGSEKI